MISSWPIVFRQINPSLNGGRLTSGGSSRSSMPCPAARFSPLMVYQRYVRLDGNFCVARLFFMRRNETLRNEISGCFKLLIDEMVEWNKCSRIRDAIGVVPGSNSQNISYSILGNYFIYPSINHWIQIFFKGLETEKLELMLEELKNKALVKHTTR